MEFELAGFVANGEDDDACSLADARIAEASAREPRSFPDLYFFNLQIEFLVRERRKS